MARIGRDCAGKISMSKLLSGFGSVVEALTSTSFERMASAAGRMMIVAVASAEGPRVPRSHRTTPADWEHDPCDDRAETKVLSAGRVSFITTAVDLNGPALLIPIVRVASMLMTAGLGEANWVMERSARAFTV